MVDRRDPVGDELLRLAGLRADGYLSEEEFVAERDLLIALDAAGRVRPSELAGRELTMLAALAEQGTLGRDEFDERKAVLLLARQQLARQRLAGAAGAASRGRARRQRPPRGAVLAGQGVGAEMTPGRRRQKVRRFVMVVLIVLPLLVSAGLVGLAVSAR